MQHRGWFHNFDETSKRQTGVDGAGLEVEPVDPEEPEEPEVEDESEDDPDELDPLLESPSDDPPELPCGLLLLDA